jgi:hypothetical protein
VHQVGFNFNFNLYKMHGEYDIKYDIKYEMLRSVSVAEAASSDRLQSKSDAKF